MGAFWAIIGVMVARAGRDDRLLPQARLPVSGARPQLSASEVLRTASSCSHGRDPRAPRWLRARGALVAAACWPREQRTARSSSPKRRECPTRSEAARSTADLTSRPDHCREASVAAIGPAAVVARRHERCPGRARGSSSPRRSMHRCSERASGDRRRRGDPASHHEVAAQWPASPDVGGTIARAAQADAIRRRAADRLAHLRRGLGRRPRRRDGVGHLRCSRRVT